MIRYNIILLVGLIFIGVLGLHAQDNNDTIAWTTVMDDVVVTAQFAPTDSRSAVHDVYTIKQEAIATRGANNLEQLLQQEANIRVSQDLILGSSISLLGIDGQNVKIMIDGVPIIGRQNGNIDLSQINLHNIERVEIVEGPLAVSYGTDALGGVINLITKKSQLKRYEFKGVTQLEDRGENRYNAQLGVSFDNGLSIRLNGGYDEFNGYSEDTLRSVLWNPKKQTYGDAYVGYRFGNDNRISYTFSYMDEDVTNLGDIRRPQFKPYAFDDFYNTKRINHALLHEGALSEKYYLQATAGYNRFERTKQSLRTNFEEDIQEELEGQQDTSTFTGLMLRAALASQYQSPINFQIGVDLRYDDATGQRILDSLSGEDNFSEIGDYAVFGSLRYQVFDPLMLEAGLRYAYNTRYDAPVIPSLHLKYDINPDWTLRASYSQGFRSPDLKELFFNFIDINHFIVGNPALLAERSDNVQVGFTHDHRVGEQRLSFKIKGFYNHIRDRIELFEFVETDEGIVPAIDTSTLRFSYFNQEIYKSQGVNLGFGFSNSKLELSTNFSMIGYYNPSSEELDDIDPFTYALEISNNIAYNLPQYGLKAALFLRTNDKRVSFFPEQNDEGETVAAQRIQDGFTMADFTLTKDFWEQRISWTVGVRNLLDVQQVGVNGIGSDGAHSGNSGTAPIGTGRNFFTRLALSLGW